MAGRAPAFFDQWMLEIHRLPVHSGPGISMAVETHLGLFAFYQRGDIRCMGAVAIHTEGPRTHVTVNLFEIALQGFVTPKAQGGSGCLQFQRIAGTRSLVAGRALFLREGLMQRVLYQAFSVGSVGAVARHTVRTLDSISLVGFVCLTVGNGMAGSTKSFSVFLDESVVIGCVRAVASKTLTFLKRGVGVFLRKAAVLGMAPEAKILSLFL